MASEHRIDWVGMVHDQIRKTMPSMLPEERDTFVGRLRQWFPDYSETRPVGLSADDVVHLLEQQGGLVAPLFVAAIRDCFDVD
jgi:hypothetical protein